jgi:HAD superfamily hydrolase (TIGR01509 family)
MGIEGILWDNDGVLVDTEGCYYRATREALASVGVELTERHYLDLFLADGRGAWHLAEERGTPPARVAELRAWRNARYCELLESEDVLLPGVPEAVAALARRYRMAIVTSSDRAPFEIAHRRAGLLRHFEFVLTSDQYRRAKPDPEPYLLGLERLRLAPERCLVVEDSERGLRAAKAAGLACWVVPRGLSRGGSFAAADRVFESISQVAAELLEARAP